MRAKIKIIHASGLENAVLFSIALLLFNLIFPKHDSTLLSIVNEALVFFTIFFLYNYLHQFLSSKTDTPISLVINVGILAALLYFILAITNSILDAEDGRVSVSFVNSLFSILLVFVFMGAIVYIFTTFRELFYLRQKKDHSMYFKTMLVFFALSFFSNLLLLFDAALDYLRDAFYVVTIVLICLNSVRVAWIAFLTKRQKYYLLILAIILSVVFGMVFAQVSDSKTMKQLLYVFSPGLLTLFSLVAIYGAVYFGVIFFTTLFHLPTAEAFDRKAEEVSSMMDLTKLITQVFDFKELADTVTTMTARVSNSDSAWLATKIEKGIELNSVHKVGYIDAENISKDILSLVEESYDRLEIVDCSLLNNLTKNNYNQYKSIAISPLKVHGNINGYLFAARNQESTFDKEDRNAIQAFADYAAVALENAKLIKESIEKERLEKEFDVARDIQKKILPSKIPSTETLDISALFVPAFEVGGDYYDFFELENNKLGFVVADVSGKGISAAFIMAEVKGVFKSLSKIIFSPRELLIKANEILNGSIDKKNFVTAVYGIIDRKNGKLRLARAGHTPILICSNRTIQKIQPAGIGLGLSYSASFANSLREMEIQLKNNDIVVCFSDGIPEAKNSNKEDFGYDRFESLISLNCHKNLEAVSNVIIKELSLFSRDYSQHDDITLVLFKWNQKQ